MLMLRSSSRVNFKPHCWVFVVFDVEIKQKFQARTCPQMLLLALRVTHTNSFIYFFFYMLEADEGRRGKSQDI